MTTEYHIYKDGCKIGTIEDTSESWIAQDLEGHTIAEVFARGSLSIDGSTAFHALLAALESAGFEFFEFKGVDVAGR
jgi:hypothetical protein